MKIDYQMQYYGVATNPRWRTDANMKIVMSAYISVKNNPLKFATHNQIVTIMIEMI